MRSVRRSAAMIHYDMALSIRTVRLRSSIDLCPSGSDRWWIVPSAAAGLSVLPYAGNGLGVRRRHRPARPPCAPIM